MALTTSETEDAARDLLRMRGAERPRLEQIRTYLTGDPTLTWLPQGVPQEVRALAAISRVNIVKLVADSTVQSMYVDGYTSAAADKRIWEIWQRNRMDRKQIGVHRAASVYGAGYVTVLPGKPVPVMRPHSPRYLTAAYGDDDDWPVYGLLHRGGPKWRLFDDQHVHELETSSDDGNRLVHKGKFEHEQDVCPIVRYLATEDLDDPVVGEIEPLFQLQDQINITTFLLLVAQHYGAHKQRYILGWMAKSEEQKLKVAASTLLTIPRKPGDVEVGEFAATDLSGYIESREATLRHLAVISQTPANELLGQLVQLSAEALDAVNASNQRKITERQTVIGEAHEQALGQAGSLLGIPVDPFAEIAWKDTERRKLPTVVAALAVLAEKLGVPERELWQMVPGVSQSQTRRWEAAAGHDATPGAGRETAHGDPGGTDTDTDTAAPDTPPTPAGAPGRGPRVLENAA
ncbi:hypothetical protein GCM10027160_23340 [Streptomyces calidiresistens]|uniref:Phage portal protein n=1 Tax=Streptomyces calidiresistens TaxID=1485586 RepID=A0A7W3T4V5_9ACTN|nr:phage portal protein [Streptomyces calidiresistens]MBB0230985.1 phage portal protein [Streptomyces calidiresistens]